MILSLSSAVKISDSLGSFRALTLFIIDAEDRKKSVEEFKDTSLQENLSQIKSSQSWDGAKIRIHSRKRDFTKTFPSFQEVDFVPQLRLWLFITAAQSTSQTCSGTRLALRSLLHFWGDRFLHSREEKIYTQRCFWEEQVKDASVQKMGGDTWRETLFHNKPNNMSQPKLKWGFIPFKCQGWKWRCSKIWHKLKDRWSVWMLVNAFKKELLQGATGVKKHISVCQVGGVVHKVCLCCFSVF